MVNHATTPDEFGLRERLDLLERAGVISARARAATVQALGAIEDFGGVPLSDESGAQFVTHLAMALTRVDRDEETPALPPIVGHEIAGRATEWQFARELAEGWQSHLGRPLPDGEVAYLVVHLSVLRERARLGQ